MRPFILGFLWTRKPLRSPTSCTVYIGRARLESHDLARPERPLGKHIGNRQQQAGSGNTTVNTSATTGRVRQHHIEHEHIQQTNIQPGLAVCEATKRACSSTPGALSERPEAGRVAHTRVDERFGAWELASSRSSDSLKTYRGVSRSRPLPGMRVDPTAHFIWATVPAHTERRDTRASTTCLGGRAPSGALQSKPGAPCRTGR